MSHIARINTKIRNLEYLKKALAEMDMEYVEAEEGSCIAVKGFGKAEIAGECELEIKTGSSYGIGLRKAADGYEMVADWWAIETFTGYTQETIVARITRQYAYETVMDKVRGMGYSVLSEEEDASENLRISVCRWA
ncbi:MAG: DUF1257 domain-containing protein [Spirochaetales bacterium]|jgi:hypothetical protein|nr:DUF1257 domain-containing protein [Spirochaetales bacterium]